MIRMPDKQYKVYSIDIFDTLVFRAVRSVRDLYYQVFEWNAELFPPGIDAEEWANMRSCIENLAREKGLRTKGTSEIYIKEAYEYLPAFWSRREEIMEAEYDTEQKICFENAELSAFIRTVKNRGPCRVVLTSDMYYTSEELKKILICAGIDLSWIDHIYVSCEAGVSKKRGGLFAYVLEKEQISVSDMFHIGDNEYSDYSMPLKQGIAAYCYDVTSHSEYRFPFLKLERLLYSAQAGEIFALRNLLACREDDIPDRKMQFWYSYGLMILGPLCTAAAEWVLDMADSSGIFRIFPLMREGRFLSRLLKTAADYRENHYDIRPLYISRKAVFLPSLEECGEKDFLYVFRSNGILIKDLFSIFGVEEYFEAYGEYADVEIVKASKILCGEHNLKEELLCFFQSEEIKEVIAQKARQSKETLLLYLNDFELEKPYITWDMGWRGYTQSALERILKKEGRFSESLNLLIAGKGGGAENVAEGCNIRGFVGSYGKNWKIISQLFPKIFELFFMCKEGTTIGYEKKGGKGIPVTKTVAYLDADEMEKLEILQQGVLGFQTAYLALAQRKPCIRQAIKKPDELCKIVARSLNMPTIEEAEAFSSLFYDQNFGADFQIPVLGKDKREQICKKGVNRCIEESIMSEVDWVAGARVFEDSLYYYKECYLQNRWVTVYKEICLVEKIIKSCTGQKIVLVGAGVKADELLYFFRIAGHTEMIEALTDKSSDRQGTYVHGIPVKRLEDDFQSEIYVITSYEYEMEMAAQVRKIKGSGVKIIQYREEEETCENKKRR